MLTLLLATLALAQEPAPAPEEPAPAELSEAPDAPEADAPEAPEAEAVPDRSYPKVPAALRRPLEPCEGEPATWLDGVSKGDPDGYLCVVRSPEALEPLLTAIRASAEDEPAKARYTRALALYLAARSHEPWKANHVRLLNPADRRLLSDAVKARRGRKSASAEHDAIFAQQPWYTVDDRYTDNKLSLVELENTRLADKPPPPPPPKPPEAGFGKVEDQPLLPPPEIEPRTCGCTSAPLQVAWMGLPLLLLGLRRRG